MTSMTAATEARRIEPAPSSAPHRYLAGNFAPVQHESTLDELSGIAIEGELPKDLNGTLLRDGPNPAGNVGSKHHWFVGDGMVHGIEFRDGRALGYRNRWLRTAHLQNANGLPAAPRSAQPFPVQANGNINVISHGGRLLALSEVGFPYELDRELATRREFDFDGALRSSMTGHPKIDPVSGELHFFGYDFGPVNLRYHRARRDGTLDRTVEIDIPRPVMMHDFGVTQTRIVFMDLPVIFDLEPVAQGYSLPFRWSDEHQARLGVMPRDGQSSDVRWINIDPCFVYHPLNAYDDGEQIVMDVVRHERTFDVSMTGPEHTSAPILVRWLIDPVKGTVTTRVLDERAQEFPRVDPRRETLKHRYGYATMGRLDVDGELMFGSLLKHDLERGTSEVHDVGDGCAAGEAVFVPSGAAEDAGYVLATVYDAKRDASDVIVLDAQNFAGAPLATVHLPVRIPFGFHGNFVPA